MKKSLTVFVCFAAIFAGWLAAQCVAQAPSYGRSTSNSTKAPAVKSRSYTDTKGIITAVTAESISVIVDKKLWVLFPKPDCIVELTGEAMPDYIKAGMMVRIYGQFDKRLKPLGPVGSVEIVSPQSPNFEPGIFPDMLPPDEEAAKAKQIAEGKAKAPPERAAANEPKPAEAAANEPDAKAVEAAGTPTMIVGQLNVVKDGELFVAAGNRLVRAKLADDAKISVSLTDFTLAKKGDAMKKFSCDYYQTGRGAAKLLIIELTNPLEGPKKPAKKTAAKPPAKNGPKAIQAK